MLSPTSAGLIEALLADVGEVRNLHVTVDEGEQQEQFSLQLPVVALDRERSRHGGGAVQRTRAPDADRTRLITGFSPELLRATRVSLALEGEALSEHRVLEVRALGGKGSPVAAVLEVMRIA